MGIYGRSYVPPIIIRGRPGAGANQIGLAVETDTSIGLGKKRGISLASEADSALTVARATSAPFVAAVGSGGRYLVDQYGSPIFVRGCSPQDMAGAYTPTNVATLWADQAARGINAAQVHAMVTHNTGSVDYNGDPPWTNMSTFSGTSAATDRYWAFMDTNISTAATAGITVFLTIVDNITLGSNAAGLSDPQATAYGTFLGNRYKASPNIVWVVGNDWQGGQWSVTESKYRGIINAIKAAGDTHLVTVWLNYTTSISTDIVDVGGYTAWSSLIDINAVYDYSLPYYPSELAWTRSAGSGNPRPVLGFEWNYEGVHYHTEFGQTNTTRLTVRRDAWWCVTSGGQGQFFGQDNVINANEALDLSGGALGSGYATDNAVLNALIPTLSGWHRLVPDFSSTFLTGGRGSKSTAENVDPLDNTYATGGVTADGTLGLSYFPSSRGSITYDTSKLRGTISAFWVDPTSGSTSSESNPAAPTHPGTNAAGDSDFVLVHQGTGGGSGRIIVAPPPAVVRAASW